jgi:hypothetical protein
MSRYPDSCKLDLSMLFRRVQETLLAQLSLAAIFEHPTAHGTATELHWQALLDNYLPKRFRAASAFILNAEGSRSRQIDIAIYDQMTAPPLFPHPAGIHLPIESVHGVFEVKPSITRQWLRDAHVKATSVQDLAPRQPLITGILATTSVWTPQSFPAQLRSALADTPLTLGCALEHGAFEIPGKRRKPRVSEADEALIFFLLRLTDRLNELPPSRPPNLARYASGLASFRGVAAK